MRRVRTRYGTRMRGSFVLTSFALATLAIAPPVAAQVRTGVDVLVANGCATLRGQKVGLITNHTGRTSDGRRTVDVLHQAGQVELIALFSPEHGWQGIVVRPVHAVILTG